MTMKRGLCAAAVLMVVLHGAGCTRSPSSQQRQAWSQELAQLQAEQDLLRQRAAVLVSEDPRIQNLPKGDVVVAVPTAFLTSVVERLFTDVVSSVTLSVSGIRVHSAQTIKKIRTIGEFAIDIDISEITGTLRPGLPVIGYGGNQVSLRLPIELTEGRGEATIHFVWDGKHLAGATCGDMDVTQKVSGNVIPTTYTVSGALTLGFEGRQVIGVPTFPETRLNIRVKPSQETWKAIDALLEEKDGLCGWVLDKVNVPNILTNVVEKKGFNVKLPLQKIKPLVLPAGLSETVKVGERTIALAVQTNTLRIDPDAIWYSASVALAFAPPAADAPATPAERDP
jgi:hypothetical protein